MAFLGLSTLTCQAAGAQPDRGVFVTSSASAQVAKTDRHLILQTTDVDVDSVGAAEGSLDITIDTGGVIQGFFRPVETSSLTDVHGSLKGNRMILFIGQSAAPISGTYADGKLDAHVIEGNREHHFTAIAADTVRS